MHRHNPTDQPTRERLAALLERAEQNITAQRDAYGTELDEDRAWHCAWNTWRTLADLTAAVRALTTVPPMVPVLRTVRADASEPLRSAA